MKIHKTELSIKFILLAVLAIIGSTYLLYQARFMVLGPIVQITYPKNGTLVAASMVSVEGLAKNAAWISLNDRQIFTDESGRWKEDVVVPPGTNVVTVKTRDRFGREAERSVEIFAN